MPHPLRFVLILAVWGAGWLLGVFSVEKSGLLPKGENALGAAVCLPHFLIVIGGAMGMARKKTSLVRGLSVSLTCLATLGGLYFWPRFFFSLWLMAPMITIICLLLGYGISLMGYEHQNKKEGEKSEVKPEWTISTWRDVDVRGWV